MCIVHAANNGLSHDVLQTTLNVAIKPNWAQSTLESCRNSSGFEQQSHHRPQTWDLTRESHYLRISLDNPLITLPLARNEDTLWQAMAYVPANGWGKNLIMLIKKWQYKSRKNSLPALCEPGSTTPISQDSKWQQKGGQDGVCDSGLYPGLSIGWLDAHILSST